MSDPAMDDQMVDLAAVAEEGIRAGQQTGASIEPGKDARNLEAAREMLAAPEPGDWVSAKPEPSTGLGNLSHVQVIGLDPNKLGHVLVPSPEGARSVPVEFLQKEDIKAVEADMKKTKDQYAGRINQADEAAMQRYRDEVAKGLRKSGDMSGLGM